MYFDKGLGWQVALLWFKNEPQDDIQIQAFVQIFGVEKQVIKLHINSILKCLKHGGGGIINIFSLASSSTSKVFFYKRYSEKRIKKITFLTPYLENFRAPHLKLDFQTNFESFILEIYF